MHESNILGGLCMEIEQMLWTVVGSNMIIVTAMQQPIPKIVITVDNKVFIL